MVSNTSLKLIVVLFLLLVLFFSTRADAGYEPDQALVGAVITGDLKLAQHALENGANANTRSANQTSVLALAVFDENLLMVIKLLDWGADVNAVNKFKQTALMSAVRFGHNEIAEVLLWRGANISMMDEDGFDAIYFAWASNNLEGVGLLRKHLGE